MSNLCKHFSGEVVKSKNTHLVGTQRAALKTSAWKVGTLRAALKTTSLACILATTALTACNNEESFDMPDAGKLSINVGVNHSTSRSLLTAATLPDGDAGAIGVMLTDGDGTLTDYDAYTNVKFTGTTTSGSQKWTGATDVLLTENPGTLYAYYPWKDGTNLSAIAIETASQTDYLYATPVTGISETKANADVVMNHVLTNINLSFADGTYAGAGNITSVSVSGDGIATGGTFNAAQETPGFVADSYTGVGDAITNTTATTLGGNAIDIMVVSNDAEKPITIAATIDGVEYTATTTAVELVKGNSYQYTLTLNSTFMSVSKVTVTEWNPVTKDNLTLEKYVDTTPHVYAVAADGSLIDYNSANSSCLGVALVAGEHKFMIAKADATDGTNSTLYWGKNLWGQDVDGITNLSGNGYIGESKTYGLDFTTWTIGPVSDFNGKNNTAFIMNDYAALGKDMDSRDMCKVLETYNDGDYSDWYVPAAGQLALMYLAKNEINAALANIGGTALVGSYWSSTERDAQTAFFILLDKGGVDGTGSKALDPYRVRFIRDIVVEPKPENPTGPAIDATGKANGVYVVTATGQLVDKSAATPDCIGVAFISANQKVMISKADATDGSNTSLYWGDNLNGQDVLNLANLADITAAKADYNGKANTAAIIAGYAALGKDMDSRDMCKVLETYNEGGYTDWYVPAAGQLYEFYTNRTAINEALTAISGTTFAFYNYWSSSEESASNVWYVDFSFGSVDDGGKGGNCYVRFVRDLQ